MKAQSNWPKCMPLLIVSIAVVLFSTAGIAAIKGWLPAASNGSGDTVASMAAPGMSAKAVMLAARVAQRQARIKARANGTCAQCGLIVSMQEIAGNDEFGIGAASGLLKGNQDDKRLPSSTGYEITVRMADGSSRAINHASPANWRPGARVIVIDGTNPLRR